MCYVPRVIYLCEAQPQIVEAPDDHPPSGHERDHYTRIIRYCRDFLPGQEHGTCPYQEPDEEVSLVYPLVCVRCRGQIFSDLDAEFTEFLQHDLERHEPYEISRRVIRDAMDTFVQEMKAVIFTAEHAKKQKWRAVLDSVVPTWATPIIDEVGPVTYQAFIQRVDMGREGLKSVLRRNPQLLWTSSYEQLYGMLDVEDPRDEFVDRMKRLAMRVPFPGSANGSRH